jgi:PEP-CTERM motif
MPEHFTSANFSFLAAHDAQLVRLGALAERYFKEDPTTCLIKLRQFGETLAQLVAAKAGLFHDTQEPQADLLRRLKFERVIPREVGELFHHLRIVGRCYVVLQRVLRRQCDLTSGHGTSPPTTITFTAKPGACSSTAPCNLDLGFVSMQGTETVSAVPEPSSVMFFGSGLIGCSVVASVGALAVPAGPPLVLRCSKRERRRKKPKPPLHILFTIFLRVRALWFDKLRSQ